MYRKAVGALIGFYLILLAGTMAAMTATPDVMVQKERIAAASAMTDEHHWEGGSESPAIRKIAMPAEQRQDAHGGTADGYLKPTIRESAPRTGDAQGDESPVLFAEDEVEVLCRIVEAEAGGEDADGKLLVANVVLNRVADDTFPNSIREVVYQRENGVTQFSPVSDGRISSVEVSEGTRQAVDRALQGEDISQGALFFAARKYADSKAMQWFDENLTFLFSHGGHEFFR